MASATFPPSINPQPQGTPSQGGVSPLGKLAMLSQLIQSLAQQFPQAEQGIQMMMKGLQMVQASASAGSSLQQPPAPPR
jgi:hypothetical protein